MLVRSQDLDGRRGQENTAERTHPVVGLLGGPRTALPESVGLTEAGEIGLELQRGSTLGTGQRNGQAGVRLGLRAASTSRRTESAA